jgi:uncharacterized protein YjbI with pentapeptide repeats
VNATLPNKAVRESIEALRESAPDLHRYILTLETDRDTQTSREASRRKARGWVAGAGMRVALGGELSGRVRALTAALDAWMAGTPTESGDRRGFPSDEAGQVAAAAFGRVVRVSFVGLVVAVLPTTILVVQTALMFQQNTVIQQQLNVQIEETRQARRAQFISTLFDPVEDCREADRNDCLPQASGPARAEAARALVTLAEDSRQPLDLTGAPLAGTRLQGAHFKGARLSLAQFEGSDLTGANLQEAVLKGAFLDEALLDGARLDNADLTQAHLVEAVLTRASLTGVRASEAAFNNADLSGADLQGAILDDADLSSANLQGANLKGASLQRTSLTSANLKGADLTGADLRAASFKGADLTGATLDDAKSDKVTRWPAGFTPK